MEDGLSSCLPENYNFDIGSVSHDDDNDPEAAAEAAERERRLSEELIGAFDHLKDEEDYCDSSDDDFDDSESSDRESVNSSAHSSQVTAVHSSVKESYAQPKEPNQYSSLIKEEFQQTDEFRQRELQSIITYSEVSHHSNISDVNHSNISDVNHSNISDVNHSHNSEVNYSQISDVNHSNISDVNHPLNSEVNYSHISDVNHSNISDVNHPLNSEVNYSHISDVYHSNISDVNPSHNSDVNYSYANQLHNSDVNVSNITDVNHTDISNVKFTNASDVNHSSILDVDQSNIHTDHTTTGNQLNGEIISKFNTGIAGDVLHLGSHGKTSNSVMSLSKYSKKDDARSISNKTPSIQLVNQSELRELQILYNVRGQELEQIKREQIRAEQEIQSLKSKLTQAEGKKDKLTSSLKESQQLVSDFTHENNVLKGKLTAVELQLSHEQKAKKDAQGKLESAEITIQALEQQINGLAQSENTVRLQNQHESIVRELKLRHQKEVLKLKEENDELQKNLSAKTVELENLSSKTSQLQKNYEELQIQKDNNFHILSTKLKECQRDYRNLLESGQTSEVARIKLQVEYLQKEKSELEKQNSDLKNEVKSMREQLKTSDVLKKLLSDESSPGKNKKDQNQSEINIKIELQESLKNIQLLRTERDSLKEELDKVKRKLSVSKEKVNLFESRYKESDAKLRELQQKLEEVLPAGSIPTVQHEKQVNCLKNEIIDLQRKLREVTQNLKTSSSNGERLHEENKSLKRSIAEMMQTHVEEKRRAVESCRKRCLEIHESAVKNLKEELTSKAAKELETVCSDYEKEVAELQTKIKVLEDGLYDAKKEYLQIFEENKKLQAKMDADSVPKDRVEIKKELCFEYEKKINEVKEQMQRHHESANEKFKEEWTKQKMVEIEEFNNISKQRLDEKFTECVEKEKNNYQLQLQAEKEKILLENEEKINILKRQYETEKSSLRAELKKFFQLEWKNEMSRLQQNHQTEIASIRQTFEDKIAAMEGQIETLKEKNSYDIEFKAEKEKLDREYQDKLNYLKEQFEAEKNDLVAKLKESFQLKWKREVKEMQESHQNEIECIRQNFEKQITSLENEKKIIKENHYKECEFQEVQNIKERHSDEKQAWENEKLDLIKNEHVLKNKLSTALDIEKRLVAKIRKYNKYVSSLKKKYHEKNNELQKKIEELKNSITDKENELQNMKDEYNQDILKMKESLPKQPSVRNSGCQTGEQVVSKKTLLNVQDMFIQCLKKIAEDIKIFLLESKKRSAETLHKVLNFYHDHLISRIYQDVSKDACSISPNLCIPRINRNYQSAGSCSDNLVSPNTVPQHFNSNMRISNSTPIDPLAAGDIHTKLESYMNGISNNRMFQNARSTQLPDSAVRFEDVSFDFIPIKMNDPIYTSVKMPECSVAGGLFNHQNFLNSYPERDSPIPQIK